MGSIRAIWAIQDKLALSPDEEKAIDLKREFVHEQERTAWNPTLSVAARDFDFSDSETALNGTHQSRPANLGSVQRVS